MFTQFIQSDWCQLMTMLVVIGAEHTLLFSVML